MKTLILSNWTNQDMRGMRSYVTSYTLRRGNSELFTIHLNRQLGFYQISEFIAPDSARNFIIEQINRLDTPKIVIFDKATGNMLGVFHGNTLLDAHEEPIFHLEPLSHVEAGGVCAAHTDHNSEDYAGVLHGQKNLAAIFFRLPRAKRAEGVGSRIRRWAKHLSGRPNDVLEVQVIEEEASCLRMICAVAVILHSRGGLYLHKPEQ